MPKSNAIQAIEHQNQVLSFELFALAHFLAHLTVYAISQISLLSEINLSLKPIVMDLSGQHNVSIAEFKNVLTDLSRDIDAYFAMSYQSYYARLKQNPIYQDIE